MKNRLTLVSYRLPVRFSVAAGRLEVKQSTGGLATALSSYFDEEGSHSHELRWMGVCDISEEKYRSAQRDPSAGDRLNSLHPVFIESRVGDLFYNGFCNSVLWPLFHYFPSFVVYDDTYFAAYRKANQVVADEILATYREGDIIWIHDYHFMLLPGMLRRRIPEVCIGFFLHIPFPSYELFRVLPRNWQREIMSGLLGADVVGFHTADYTMHFRESLSRTLHLKVTPEGVPYQGRTVRMRPFPIGIDFRRFSEVANTSAVRKEVQKIRERFRASKLVLSVDRLDYTKAIVNRLESFELFLKLNPKYREKATYLLLLVPTRDSILKYRENKLIVETLIGRINGLYGTLNWTPIIYQYRSLDFPKLVALYGASHIALITPLRDGMNLVAKEFVASRPEADGVLILSDAAGCANELQQAIIVNPFDRHEIAEAIRLAMEQPLEDQRRRIQAMQEHLHHHDVRRWVEEFLMSLEPQLSP
ncbi:MAG: trehalose-6-phosphate synthase [Cyclobacteriaceae bacterium]|nr:trehalose-6-phosphate synthase [Cyclobacteriaceae bacterium]